MKVVTIIGTRPEALKFVSILVEMAKYKNIEPCILATGQHREMLDQVLKLFDIVPDYDLRVMHTYQSPADVLAIVIQKLYPILLKVEPDWVLVQGDTTSALAGALASVYSGVRLAHVEAGLRTYNIQSPFPEELNRVIIDHCSTIHFAPTQNARAALLREGINAANVYVTGNTSIDTLHLVLQRHKPEYLLEVPASKRLILVTLHRRESFGLPVKNIFLALRYLACHPDIHIIYPVHPNPAIFALAHEMLDNVENIDLVAPLDYLRFVQLMKQAYLILTDSGGIQEEASSLGVPVLVLRSITERREAMDAGVSKLVGTNYQTIVAEVLRLLEDASAYAAMARAVNPFGNGTAARQIVRILQSA